MGAAAGVARALFFVLRGGRYYALLIGAVFACGGVAIGRWHGRRMRRPASRRRRTRVLLALLLLLAEEGAGVGFQAAQEGGLVVWGGGGGAGPGPVGGAGLALLVLPERAHS